MAGSDARRARHDLVPLTSLRGIAAWCVVLFHVRGMLAPYVPGAMPLLGHGDLAVDLFFILSGFVIYLSYAERLTGSRSGIADFLLRRLARIYPLHLAMLAAFAAYALLAVAAGSASLEQFGWGYFVASLFLVQNWGFTDALRWNDPAWSISTEAFAYLLFPAIPLLVKPSRWPTAALIAAVIGLGMAVHAYFVAVGHQFPDDIPRTGLVRCVLQFAMGTLACEIYLRLREREGLSVPLLALAAVLAAGHALAALPLLPLIWTSLILGVALGRSRTPLNWRPLVYLGEISYSTYLFHYFGYMVFKLLFVQEGQAVPLPLVALYFLGVLAASVVLYHAIERPSQRWAIALWDARRERRQLATALD